MNTNRQEAQLSRTLGVAVLLTLVLLALFSGYTQRTFDAYVHLFFADHYKRGWFELFEPRWYGGFSVTSYPPLVHQLLALAMPLFGLEGSFVAVTTVVVLGLALATAFFVQHFTGRGFGLALLLAALSPTVPRFAYVYGQLPALTATALVVVSLIVLDIYLRSGRWLALVAYGALIGTVGGAHHMSVIFAAIGSAGVASVAILEDRRRLWRGLVAALLAALALGSVIWPFLKHAAAAPQAEIPHLSRLALWQRNLDTEVLELCVFILISVIMTVWALVSGRKSATVFALVLLLLVLLASGGSTPLPELLFRSQSRWLTYDKFQLWAAPLMVLPITLLWRSPKPLSLTLVILLLGPLSVWGTSHKESKENQPPFVKDIAPVLRVLGAEGAESYRHLSLGFGDQFCRFDILGRSPNVDGDYHTARNHPLLRASGISTLDSAKYYAKGPEVLRTILSEAPALSLRWVVVLDDWYFKELFAAGFELKDVFDNGVSIFEREVPPLKPPVAQPVSVLASLTWGLLPLMYTALSVVLVCLLLWQRRRVAPGSLNLET
jgi:hypothetical protein